MSRIVIVICLVIGIGCSKQTTAPTVVAIAGFETHLKPLKWPVQPDEKANTIGNASSYNAMASEKFDGGLLLYALFIIEYPDDKFDGMTPQQLMDAYIKGFGESTRTPIEHGPQKYPGVEITRKRESKWDRHVVVVAGRRLHHISVSASRNEKLLDRPEVKAFFDSFEIKD